MTPTPAPCVLEHWSSSEVDPAIRLDYWRDVAHNWVDVQPLSPGEELDASWSLLRGQASFFGTKRSTAYEMRTGPQHVPPAEDMVVLSLLQAGEMRLNAAPGERQHATAGMLGMYVPEQEGCYRWGAGARQTYLALPRRLVWDTLGHKPGNTLLLPQSVAQLGWWGLPQQSVTALAPYVTLLPVRTLVNLNTASAVVLWASADGLDMADAQRLVQRRESQYFRNLADAAELVRGSSAISASTHAVASHYFEVRGRLRIGERRPRIDLSAAAAHFGHHQGMFKTRLDRGGVIAIAQPIAADGDFVADAQFVPAGRLAVQPGAVGAFAVFEIDVRADALDQRVVAGNHRAVEHDVAVAPPADRDAAAGQPVFVK